MLTEGTLVDHFRVMRPLGRGGMGEVYLARDTRLGRKVALKVILPSLLGSEEAVERFLFEAKATAGIEHPNIVTVFAVGEYRARPYLALEYLEGASLRERIERDRPGLRESLRICLAVAEALKAAHAGSILHRDLKPENVVLASDGRVRVKDLGLARGTPAYMAPEQWQEEITSGATDVWALGVMLYELVCGRRPYEEPGADRLAVLVCGPEPAPALRCEHKLPTGLIELVARCLQKNPADRPTAAAMVELLQAVLASGGRAASAAESPFLGLTPFEEQHRHLFFGREDEVRAFVLRARMQTVLPVVGPSGAGKSSFVQAGVIPRLRERGPLVVLSMRPGAKPFETLASRIVTARKAGTPDITEPEQVAGLSEEEQLARQLRASPHLLNLVLHRLARQRKADVLLFVDQLEELHALVPDADERRAFMQAACAAADDPAEPVRVVMTLREDFLGRLSTGAGVREALGRIVLLRNLDEDNLARIMTRPVQVLGYEYDDPHQVARMVDEVQGETACLPLLQFAGQLLWERRDRVSKVLRSAVYESMGGVGGALARHADGVIKALGPEDADLARGLLLRLVTAEGTRRVLPHSRLIEGLGRGAERVLKRLVEARLVAGKQAEEGLEAELELANESLVAAWSRLGRWIEESRDELFFLGEVDQAAELWDKRGRRAEEVWQGQSLRDAERAATHCTRELPELVGEFLRAGQRRERRRAWSRRALYAALVILLAAFSLVFWAKERETRKERDRVGKLQQVAEAQRDKARKSEQEAMRAERDAREKLAETLTEKATSTSFAHEAVLYAAAALRLDESPDARVLLSDLLNRPRPRLLWQSEPGASCSRLSYSPDGRTLACASGKGGAILWDTGRGREMLRLSPRGGTRSVSWSPDGKLLATSTWIGTIQLWDMSSRREVLSRSAHRGGCSIVFSPDGRSLASFGGGDRLIMWDRTSGDQLAVVKSPCKELVQLAFTPDGKKIASGCDAGEILLWSTEPGGEPVRLEGHQGRVTGLAFSPDGKYLASGGQDGWIILWDPERKEEIHRLAGHGSKVLDLALSPDGKTLASTGKDGIIRLWDIEERRERARLEGHAGPVLAATFSPDSHTLASSGADGSVRLWDAVKGDETARLGGHGSRVSSMALAPDGRRLLSAGERGDLRSWDAGTGEELEVAVLSDDGSIQDIHAVALAADGKTMAIGAGDGRIHLWQGLSQAGADRMVMTLEGHEKPVFSLAFAPDGRLLVSAGRDNTVRVWNLRPDSSGEHRQVRELRTKEGILRAMALSPDGKHLATGGDGTHVVLRELETGRPIGSAAAQHVYALAFSPDGRTLAAGCEEAILFDVPSMTRVAKPRGDWQGRVCAVGFSPDGGLLALVDRKAVRVWDLKPGRSAHRARELFRLSNGDRVKAVAFTTDGQGLATAGDDGVRMWTLSDWREDASRQPKDPQVPDAPVEKILERVTRESGLVFDGIRVVLDPERMKTRFTFRKTDTP